MTAPLLQLMLRDLDRLQKEMTAYDSPEKLWTTPGAVQNSAGNLCLHLAGNLQHFIGGVLGGSGYVRNREFEFNAKDVPVEKLLEEIAAAKVALNNTLPNVSQETLNQTYPLEVFGEPMSTELFLLHLQGHLNYHLGQINYHRRLTVS